MIINSVGAAFAGGSGQNTGGTSSQTDPAQEDTAASGSGQTGGTAATGSSSTSLGSSNGQTGSQAGGQSTASSASQSAASQTAATAQSAALAVETGKAPSDEDALRTQALEVQKRMNTDMLIRSLGASTGTDLSLLSEAEPEAPVPLAVAAYAENFNQSAVGPAKAAA